MNRPMMLTGFTVFFTLVFVGYLGYTVAAVLLLISLTGFLICMAVKNLRVHKVMPIAVGAMLLACVLFVTYFNLSYVPVTEYFDREADVKAEIVSLPDRVGDHCYYELEVLEIDGEPVSPFRLRFSSRDKLDASHSDIIEFSGKLYELGSGDASSKRSYMAKKLYIGAYATTGSVEIVGTARKGIRHAVLSLRAEMIEGIKRMLPRENAGIVLSVILGERSYISDDVYDAMKVTGISHVIAISGMHVSIISAAFHLLLGKLRFGYRIRTVFSMCFVLFFMALSGFSPSVCRAGIMMLLYLSAGLFGRDSDSLNSLGFATLILMCLNPFMAWSLSFMLSFSATLGIILLATKIDKFFCRGINHVSSGFTNRTLKRASLILSVTLAANIGTLPVSILILGYVSVISPLTNLLIIPVASVLLVTSGLTALLSLLHFGPLAYLAYPFGFTASALSAYIIKVVLFLAEFPFTIISMQYTYVYLWLAGSLLIFAFAIYLRRNTTLLKATAIILVVVLLLAGFSYSVTHRDVIEMQVLDVGDGIAVTLTRGGEGVAILSGGNYMTASRTRNALERRGVSTLSLLIVPTIKAKEYKYASEFFWNFDVQKIAVPEDGTMDVKMSRYPGMEVVAANEAEFYLWGDTCYLRYQMTDDGYYVLVTIGTKTYLICSGENAGGYSGETMLNMTVSDTVLPHDVLARSGYVILSSGDISAESIVAELRGLEYNIVATNGSSSFSLQASEHTQSKLRRIQV